MKLLSFPVCSLIVLCSFVYSGAWVMGDEGQAISKSKPSFAIAIHGGAGRSPSEFDDASNERRRATLKLALDRGVEILKSGGSSLEAVEAVILILEDDSQFNAGKGSVFNAEGSHELDASIMDGKTLNCGAVAGVSHVKNPISLARLVMTETRHVLLAGEGAESFARKQGVTWVEPSYFDTPEGRAAWERFKKRLESRKTGQHNSQREDRRGTIGTVGCVALDQEGNLAAGTSTGGMTNKKWGRIGDSPIVGAGTYADNSTCAVSGTGFGEQYIRNAVAYDVSAQMKYGGKSLDDAIKDNLKKRLNPGDGGLIAVDKDGNISMEFNTGGMSRAAADSNGRYEVLWGND